jgi:hypothetical protein
MTTAFVWTQPSTRMNGLERQYGTHLDLLRGIGEIVEWKYEAVKLRLARNTWYTPDFLVIRSLPDPTWWTPGQPREPRVRLEFHEVKGGFCRDDARAKFKIAAEQYSGWASWHWITRARNGAWLTVPT